MFDSVISGRLIRDPKLGHTKTGKPMASVLLKVACEGADDTALVSAVAFEKAAEKLGKLGKGDAVSAAGALKPTTYTKDGEQRHGLSLTAAGILTAYKERQRRPEAKSQDSDGRNVKAFYEAGKSRYAPEPDDFNDAVSF